jgi:hypothetical protein
VYRIRAAGLAGLIVLALAWPAALAGQAGVRSIGDDSVRVVFWPGHEVLAERILATARAQHPLPGLPLAGTIAEGTIILAPTPEVFDSLASGAPGWSAAVAIPGLRRIILPAYRTVRTSDPARTLRHEMAHLALNAYLPAGIPRWFDEGYATWASGEWDEDAAWALRIAFLLRRAPPLDDLELTWPSDHARARVAYHLSATAVAYLHELGGERGFEALLAAWSERGTLDSALRVTYGMTQGQFEERWAKAVRRRYGWLLALAQMTFFWMILGVLVFALWIVRKRRQREQLAGMQVRDRLFPPEDPDGEYWLEVESETGPTRPPGGEDPAEGGVDGEPGRG